MPANECFKGLRDQSLTLIDVRSEGEYADGSFPGSISAPILNNDRRHLVGLCYKNHGQEKAILVGHELVEGDRDSIVEGWIAHLKAAGTSKPGAIMCWRGGLRSQISQEWVAEAGMDSLRVDGGYKAVRREALNVLERDYRLLILAGMTGTGKTDLLVQIPGNIDLEALANHRGSVFGRPWHDEQPAQVTFENALAFELARHSGPILVEDESRLIGRNAIPEPFFNVMSRTPVVVLECSIEQRVERIYRDYVKAPLDSGVGLEEMRLEMLDCIQRIRNRLGGLLAGQITDQINAAFDAKNMRASHQSWIHALLVGYYDRHYAHALERNKPDVRFRGEANACREWLVEEMARIAKDG